MNFDKDLQMWLDAWLREIGAVAGTVHIHETDGPIDSVTWSDIDFALLRDLRSARRFYDGRLQ